jgi:hypothetical protein
MGFAGHFTKEKLICGILYRDNDFLDLAQNFLAENFGPADYMTEPRPFSFSDYYDDEMGKGVTRIFIAFAALVDPARMAAIKTATNAFEQQIMRDGKRMVNLDPGLISTGRLLLATTKNAGHRFALADGIYGEITLFYSRRAFQALPWTYPDFRSEEVRKDMNAVRRLYREQLKTAKAF